MQNNAAHCRSLQITAARCNTLQHRVKPLLHTGTEAYADLPQTATYFNTLQHTFKKLLRTDTNAYPDLQHTATLATHCTTLQYSATNCNTLTNSCSTQEPRPTPTAWASS